LTPSRCFYQFGLALTLGVAREIEGDPAAIERAVRVAVGPLTWFVGPALSLAGTV
jgi:hypothetical protein